MLPADRPGEWRPRNRRMIRAELFNSSRNFRRHRDLGLAWQVLRATRCALASGATARPSCSPSVSPSSPIQRFNRPVSGLLPSVERSGLLPPAAECLREQYRTQSLRSRLDRQSFAARPEQRSNVLSERPRQACGTGRGQLAAWTGGGIGLR